MIPVSLEFSGLNSYREQQSIDFSDLMSQGLFGIFGVTGAGKSTVLDAMTLALFGQVNRAPSRTQGIINARENRCRVRFVFGLSGHSYAAERVFERVKGDPYSCTARSCRLVEDGSLVLADKSRVMDGEIEKLLNMDCERFCQTVILPQ
ncbi:MAG: SMC family ATPase, partial [Firmicutes bacterium]|nr:SMC family ATPase [Bacillota bacterium]